MSTIRNLTVAVVIGLAVGAGKMTYDKWSGAEWEVSPQQIAQAKAEGKAGYETRPGTVAFLPIRSETADLLPVEWTLYGLGAAALVFFSLRRKKTA